MTPNPYFLYGIGFIAIGLILEILGGLLMNIYTMVGGLSGVLKKEGVSKYLYKLHWWMQQRMQLDYTSAELPKLLTRVGFFSSLSRCSTATFWVF